MSKRQTRFSALHFYHCSVSCKVIFSYVYRDRRSGRSLSSERKRDSKVSSSCLGRNSSGNSGLLSTPSSFVRAGWLWADAECRVPSSRHASSPESPPLRDGMRPTPATETVDLVPLWGILEGTYNRGVTPTYPLNPPPCATEIHLMAGVNAERNGGNER